MWRSPDFAANKNSFACLTIHHYSQNRDDASDASDGSVSVSSGDDTEQFASTTSHLHADVMPLAQFLNKGKHTWGMSGWVLLWLLFGMWYLSIACFMPRALRTIPIPGLPDVFERVYCACAFLVMCCVSSEFYFFHRLIESDAFDNMMKSVQRKEQERLVMEYSQQYYCYVFPILSFYIVVLVYLILDIGFAKGVFLFVIYLSPFLVRCTVVANRRRDIVLRVCIDSANSMCNKLECEAQTWQFWLQRTYDYRAFRDRLERVMWKVWPALLFRPVPKVHILFTSLVIVINADELRAKLFFLTIALAGAGAVILDLKSLAELTSICQTRLRELGAQHFSGGFLREGGIVEAVNFQAVGASDAFKAREEHGRFMHYVMAAPIGGNLPLIGAVTYKHFYGLCNALFFIAPVLYTCVLRSHGAFWHMLHDVERSEGHAFWVNLAYD